MLRNGTRIKCLIQACYDISNKKTEKREVGALIECAEELKCTNLMIITNQEEKVIAKDGYMIRVVPVSRF